MKLVKSPETWVLFSTKSEVRVILPPQLVLLSKIQKISQLWMRYSHNPDEVGIKTWCVLQITWHVVSTLFSDINCQRTHLGAVGFKHTSQWVTTHTTTSWLPKHLPVFKHVSKLFQKVSYTFLGSQDFSMTQPSGAS